MFAQVARGVTLGGLKSTAAAPTFKYYVANVQGEDERMDFMVWRMPKHVRQNACRVDGVNGLHLSERDFTTGRYVGLLGVPLVSWDQYVQDRESVTRDFTSVTHAAAGCFLSHLKAWQQIEKDGVDIGIVLEDDVTVWSESYDEDLRRWILTASETNSSAPWDMAILSLAKSEDQEHETGPVGALVPYLGKGTAAVAVRRTSIPAIRNSLLPIRGPIDRFMGHVNGEGIRFVRTDRSMVNTYTHRSDVQEKSKDERDLRAHGSHSKAGGDRVYVDLPDCA